MACIHDYTDCSNPRKRINQSQIQKIKKTWHLIIHNDDIMPGLYLYKIHEIFYSFIPFPSMIWSTHFSILDKRVEDCLAPVKKRL